MGRERRRHIRFTTDCGLVQYETVVGRKTGTGKPMDLSQGGLRFRLEEGAVPLTASDRITAVIALGPPYPPMRFSGEVRFVGKPRSGKTDDAIDVAVMFVDLDERQRAFLHDVVVGIAIKKIRGGAPKPSTTAPPAIPAQPSTVVAGSREKAAPSKEPPASPAHGAMEVQYKFYNAQWQPIGNEIYRGTIRQIHESGCTFAGPLPKNMLPGQILSGAVQIGLCLHPDGRAEVRLPSRPTRVTPLPSDPPQCLFTVTFPEVGDEERQALRSLGGTAIFSLPKGARRQDEYRDLLQF